MGFAPGSGVDPPDFHSADPLLALILGPPKKERKKSSHTLSSYFNKKVSANTQCHKCAFSAAGEYN